MEMPVTRLRILVIAAALAGLVSSALAVSLMYFVATHPLRVTEWIGRGL